jgi:hypothetical protein
MLYDVPREPLDAWEVDERPDAEAGTWLTWRLVATVSVLAFVTSFAMAAARLL